MSQLHSKITAVLAAALIYGGSVVPSAGALSTSANPTVSGEAIATVTGMSGTVFKRGFVDWEKEVWGQPEAATVNDQLREGMQIGTGNNSWAEVSWPNVKTRAWQNTVFAIAPNKRLVYLTGGEMLFRLDKHRKDKDQSYFIWTKVLQARIRGTTVLVQVKGLVTRFTVMEGTVEVLNRLDHSKVTLKPGVVFEIVGYNQPNTSNNSGETSKPKPIEPPQKIGNAVNDILYDAPEKSKVPLLHDRNASTNVYPANSEALKSHPLNMAGGEIDSMQLIKKEQAELPGVNPLLPIRTADNARLNKVISSGVELDAVPSNADYFVGQAVGKIVRLPESASHLPPKGMILDRSSFSSATSPTVAVRTGAPPAAPIMIPLMPITNTAAAEAPVAPSEGAASAKGIFEDLRGPASHVNKEELELPPVTQEFPQQSVLTSAADKVEPVATQNPAMGAFQPMPGALPNISGMGAAGFTPGSAGGGPAGASASAAMQAGLGGGLGSPVNGSIQTFSGGPNNSINSALTGATRGINGVLNGVGNQLH